MSYALVANVSAKSTNSNGFTTGAINTTGATLLVAMETYYIGGGVGAISDSKSNTWIDRTAYSNSVPAVRISYCVPSSVGSGHTFTVGGSGNYSTLTVYAFSGGAALPYDGESGAGSTDSTPQPGSITPTQDGDVLVSVVSWNTDSTACTAIDGGFTLLGNQNSVGGQCVAGACAYLIQTSAAPANPSFTLASSELCVVAIAAFKAAAAGGSAIKTVNGVAKASVKTFDGVAIAAVKTIDGLA